jgi:sterol 3beta-glucosyltransferase
MHDILSAPVADAPEMPDRAHPADVLAPPKEALFKTRAWPDEALAYMPFVANRPRESATRLTPRTFAMLTIGSRGDVQPYIALALRLKKDGHTIVIITHEEFKGWIEGYGLIHRQAGGDPTALMKLSQEHAVSQSIAIKGGADDRCFLLDSLRNRLVHSENGLMTVSHTCILHA